MADFILNRNRKISGVYPYPFPEGSFQIYGNGIFYNGFSIDNTTNLSVVNKDGLLKFSRGASNASETTTVILGSMPKNKKKSIYIDIASPLSQSITDHGFKLGAHNISTIKEWTTAEITRTEERYQNYVQAGVALGIYFKSATSLPEIPDLLAVRAIWVN